MDCVQINSKLSEDNQTYYDTVTTIQLHFTENTINLVKSKTVSELKMK